MAKVDFRGLGPISGKCGNVIFCNYHGKTIMKAAPFQVKQPNTEIQMLNKEKFRLTQAHIKSLIILFRVGWQEMAKEMSAVNAASSYLSKNAFSVEEGKVIFDKTK